MRKIRFNNEAIYHVYNRGAEKRKIFMDGEDHFRFIHDLFEFNDVLPAGRFVQFAETRRPQNSERGKRKLFVEILAFCMMPNHFHLILRQKRGGGVADFMKKLAGGYAKYFNEKYDRVGSLFQGRFKAIEVAGESYFLQLSRYIHLNPLSLIEPEWKEEGIKNRRKVREFLENYRWSSYLDYIGSKNFPSLTAREFLIGLFDGNVDEYGKFVREWDPGNLENIDNLTLEEEKKKRKFTRKHNLRKPDIRK